MRLEEALDAAHALQPTLNAFITLAPHPSSLVPRSGTPYAIKDMIATAGVRTTAGSRILADWIPARDAAIVTAMRRRGYIAIGKTNTHEFAWGTTNDNPHYGATHNPWAPHLTTGGSSGGSAAAVAAGIVPLALGTDTAGSVRIPAALCGCVGFKPGWGRLSTAGVIPLAPTLDTVGFLAARVADAQRAFGTRGAGRPRTIGVVEAHAFARSEPAVVRAVEEALRLLERKGARIRRLAVPALDEVVSVGTTLGRWEAFQYHRRWYPARRAEYGPDVLRNLDAAQQISRAGYEVARAARRRLSRLLRRVMEEVDVIAGPTVPIVAFENRTAWEPVLAGGELPRFALTRLTYPWSLGRLPAITVPCGLADGLPVGLQLAAAAGREPALLAAAAAYETARGPWPAPPVSVTRPSRPAP